MSDIRESEGRNRWGKARERDRRRARREIRVRVANAATISSNGTTLVDAPSKEEENGSIQLNDSTTLSEEETETVKQMLRYVEAGKVAAFSLTTLSKHFELLNKPIPVSLLSPYKIKTLCTSRFGPGHAQLIQNYVEALETCTLLEYASLLGEYRLLGPMITGGLDPTARGRFKDQGIIGDNSELCAQQRRLALSAQVMKRFFDSFPSSLSSFIVKRVVDMRLEHWNAQSDCKTCIICGSSDKQDMLAFGSPCHDSYCEDCFWQDMLDSIDHRMEGSVVLCPACGVSDASGEQCTETTDTCTSPSERCQESLTKFQALPANQKELKQLPRRRKSRQRALTWSWSEAVSLSIGSSQDIRKDKFFSFTERGAYHFVRGCVKGGVDVNATNEYGQTCLHVAAWRGHTDIVELLLQFGANTCIVANGGVCVVDSAESNGHVEIVRLLRDHSFQDGLWNGTSSIHEKGAIDLNHMNSSPSLEVLIDEEADHPGAGSYLIDHGFSLGCVDSLTELWKDLPVDECDRRKKKGSTAPCSVRSYYCDSLGHIGNLLTTVIRKALDSRTARLQQVSVFPHMRFLHYAFPGSVLAPHVDLPRNDISGNQSTHTFILYLYDCDSGGETSLLAAERGDGREVVLATVSPRKGRLLLFPHSCPHEGNEVMDVPKVLLRGEVVLTRQ